jgi:hypothetical protein
VQEKIQVARKALHQFDPNDVYVKTLIREKATKNPLFLEGFCTSLGFAGLCSGGERGIPILTTKYYNYYILSFRYFQDAPKKTPKALEDFFSKI